MPTTFAFLILPDIHLLDLAGPNQAIHEAMDFQADFIIEYGGIPGDVHSTSGLPVGRVKHFTKLKLKKGDFLIIPGASYKYMTSKSFLQNKDLFEWIKSVYHQGVNICSICMGAFALAETGLLDGKTCTTHFKKTKELKARYPALNVVENILFTDQQGIYTSAGIASGIDLMLYIIEKLKGGHFAHLVARELVVYNRRSGNESQESEFLKFRNHIHTGIHKVQDYIIENIHSKHPLHELAERASMSERNFTRVFRKETGISVINYTNGIRRVKAIQLLKNPDLSFSAVANKVGLQSERQLKRILAGTTHEKEN